MLNIESKCPIVSLSVFIKTGSVDEREGHSGAAHFLEHLHFKGTSKRPKDHLEIEIEDNGGSLNAFTTREYTCYLLEMPNSNAEWGIELISDLLRNSKYSE